MDTNEHMEYTENRDKRNEHDSHENMEINATDDDMADMVLFLASPAGRMVSGQAVPVDGYTIAL